MRVNFTEINLTAKKTGVCAFCGVRATRSKRFWQTISPFNKNKNGEIKTRDEIMSENKERATQWQKEPIFHAKCEPF